MTVRLLLAGLLLAPTASGAPAAQLAVARETATIPFERAEVTRAGDALTIRWRAPGAGAVTLTAHADPAAADTLVSLGRAASEGELTVTLPPRADDRRWFVRLTPARGAPLVIAERVLGLATAPNFRDLGGYRTADGRWVRMGLLFRSDQLNLLSDSDLAQVQAAGIATVADLRTDAERAREPDRVPAGARQLVFDVGAGQDPAPFMALLAKGEGQAAMIGLYRDFPQSAGASAAINGLIGTIADASSPVLFHCTAGKDRTGWASAVLLSMLGVPRETVIADYLASNALLEAKNKAIFASISSPYTVDQIRPVMTVDRAFIAASFAEVDRRYGSIERYAREALGIDAAALARLRDRYLAGAVAVPAG